MLVIVIVIFQPALPTHNSLNPKVICAPENIQCLKSDNKLSHSRNEIKFC